MWQWAPYPFLRITPVLIAGILVGYYANSVLPVWCCAVLFMLFALITWATPRRYAVHMRIPAGIVGLALIGSLGAGWAVEKQDHYHALHLSKAAPISYYLATVNEPPQRRGDTFRTIVSAQAWFRTDSLHQVTHREQAIGQVMLYLPLADSLQLPAYGDMLLISGTPRGIPPPVNPHMFDYRQYMADKNIYLQQHVTAQDWRTYQQSQHVTFSSLAYELREKSTSILLKTIPNVQGAAVALALTIGVKDYLDDEISQSYAATGAMHVLAVSGLHVGIIYLVLAFLLKPVVHLPNGTWLNAGLCIAALWFYALLAGWSPSVLRATVMFTVIIIAKASGRHSNIFNTLAVSAFILLCANPLLLFSVSFQLSYLAVAGIVYLQPKIYRWMPYKNWLQDKVWGLTAVSIAAQLATFPIALYYFHQFPVYFWLANLLVIPAAFVILSLGLLTITTGLIAMPLASYPGGLLTFVIRWVNQGIAFIQHLPASTWQDIALDIPQMLLVYAYLVILLLLLHYRRLLYLYGMLMVSLLFASISFAYFYVQNQQRSITFYQVDRQSNMDFTHGIQNFHWGEMNEQAIYQISANHLQTGLHTLLIPATLPAAPPVALSQSANLHVAVWHGKKIVLIDKPFTGTGVPHHKIKVDIVVIRNNAVKDLKAVCDRFDFSLLVVDSSNHRARAQKLAQEARVWPVVCHAVPQQGALTVPLFP